MDAVVTLYIKYESQEELNDILEKLEEMGYNPQLEYDVDDEALENEEEYDDFFDNEVGEVEYEEDED